MTDRGRRDSGTAAQRLGGALRDLQQRSGRPPRSLQRQAGSSASSLSRYFCGTTVPPWPVVRDLCEALGADPGEYRALWEAAALSTSAPSEAAAAPGESAPPPGTPAPTAPQPSAPTRSRLARSRLVGRGACAVLGLLAGTLLGAALVAYVPQLTYEQQGARGARALGTTGQNGALTAPNARFDEAEKARLHKARSRDSPGASGGWAVGYIDFPDIFVEFTVRAASAGPPHLVRTVRQRHTGHGTRDTTMAAIEASHNLSVNGRHVTRVHYEHTGWENWKTTKVSVVLREGRNTIRLSKDDDYAELDGIEV